MLYFHLSEDYLIKVVSAIGTNAGLFKEVRFAEMLINNYCGEFKEHITPLLDATSGAPALYFIDPFGYKGIHMDDIHKISSGRSHEVLINVVSYSLVKNYRIENNHEELCRFFGSPKLPQNIIEYIRMASKDDVLSNQITRGIFEKLEDQIIDLYIFNLKQVFTETVYTLKKRIYSPLNPNVYFSPSICDEK